MQAGRAVAGRGRAAVRAPGRWQGYLGLLRREGAIICWGTLGLFLLVSLATYSPDDPGWSRTGGAQVENTGGVVGAWVADVLYVLFGYLAWAVPLLMLGRLARLFVRPWRGVQGGGPEYLEFLLRFIGMALLVISGSAVAESNWQAFAGMPEGGGGIIGQALGPAILQSFGATGANMLLLALFLFGLTLFLDISWMALCDALGLGILRGAAYLRGAAVRLRGAWRRWQERRQQTEQAEQARLARQKILANEATIRKKAPTIAKRTPAPPKQTSMFDSSAPGRPSMSLLHKAEAGGGHGYSSDALKAMARQLEVKLAEFKIKASVVGILPGPVITRFEVEPEAGLRASRISGIAQDLARSLTVVSVRVVRNIPGKSCIGIEIPNERRAVVRLREVLEADAFKNSKSDLSLALGHDILGQAAVEDLAGMPHLLVAGTTGSGKSVAVNAMLLSLLYKSGPEQVRLILIDPKMLELSVYEGVPHLLSPVITDMKDAAAGLGWCVAEMDRRYEIMAGLNVRSLASYNREVRNAAAAGAPLRAQDGGRPSPEGEGPPLDTMPSIVVVVDEFADMIMVVGKQVEQLIARIAQKARAAGIHLILATQRPSMQVITGLIKANIPARMAFQVSSATDSRIILDQGGAEQLLGHGDMLFLPSGKSDPVRIHGALVEDKEVAQVVRDWRRRGRPRFVDLVSEQPAASGGGEPGTPGDDRDEMYAQAVAFVCKSRKATISSLQRELRIGYQRSARMIDAMENDGIVSAADHSGSRQVLAPPP